MIASAIHVLIEIGCALAILGVVFILATVAVNEVRDRRRLAADRAHVARCAHAAGVVVAAPVTPMSDTDRFVAGAIGVTKDPLIYAGLADELLLRRRQHEREREAGQ